MALKVNDEQPLRKWEADDCDETRLKSHNRVIMHNQVQLPRIWSIALMYSQVVLWSIGAFKSSTKVIACNGIPTGSGILWQSGNLSILHRGKCYGCKMEWRDGHKGKGRGSFLIIMHAAHNDNGVKNKIITAASKTTALQILSIIVVKWCSQMWQRKQS